MKEIAITSGKGGTGKTSLVASLAALAKPLVLADCDVDAADLHLVTDPEIYQRAEFVGGKKAEIRSELCRACGQCRDLCRFEAIHFDGPGNSLYPETFRVEPTACEGCGVCVRFCPNQAIDFEEQVVGTWSLSETRFGPMAHAELLPGGENSGRLVTLVREKAKYLAGERGLDLVLIDGPPGIGCPVIASVTGADLVLIVTEPTVAGIHDMERMIRLADHFQITPAVLINRSDIDPQRTEEISILMERLSVPLVGCIPYDRDFYRAQIECLSLIEFSDGPAVDRIREAWSAIETLLGNGAVAGEEKQRRMGVVSD